MAIKTAVIFHRLGPYHHARLLAAAQKLEMLAIEESADSNEYAWDPVDSGADFARTTLLAAGERPSRPASEIARRMRVALDRFRPEVVVIPGWSDPAALAALDWALSVGSRAVVMSESTAWDEARISWKEWIKSRVVRLCSAALVGGTPHAEYVAALGLPPARIFLGYDVVDNEHFAAGARAARAEESVTRARHGLPERYFLASSRFLPQKNLPVLLTAYAEYRRLAGPAAWKLVLLGDGPLRPSLAGMIDASGLAGDVLMPGFKQYEELPAYYGLAGAFVHASTREPWGLVVNEAMAAGLPLVVSAKCGCAGDLVIDGENG